MKDKGAIKIKPIMDDPVVRVAGDLEASIKILRRKITMCKTFKILKTRQ